MTCSCVLPASCHVTLVTEFDEIVRFFPDNAVFEVTSNEETEMATAATKTHTGNSDPRPFAPKMFPDLAEPSKCPIRMYKLYRANRPQNMSHEDSPFFLGINRNGKSSQWYHSQPMGHDTLGSIMNRMCVAAGLRGNHTNHSVRITMMTNSVQANIDSNLTCQLSGHKNVNSVNRYAVASKFQQKEMCNVLQNPDESSNM